VTEQLLKVRKAAPKLVIFGRLTHLKSKLRVLHWLRRANGIDHRSLGRGDAAVSPQRSDLWWTEPLLTAAPVPIFAVDREWRMVYANDDCRRRFAITDADLGGSAWDAFPAAVRAHAERYARAAMVDGDETEFVVRGHFGWFRGRIRPFPEGLLVSLFDVTEQKIAELHASRLAAEQGMLRRVAEAAVRGIAQGDLFEMIARELGQLLGVRAASVGRDLDGIHTEVLGNWTADRDLQLQLGVRVSDPDHEFRRAVTEGRAIRSTAADGTISRVFGAAGCQAAFAVPIYAGGRLWGGLVTASMDPDAFSGDDARHQIELSELAGLAIGNAEAQEQLVRLATTDPLTGLVNHRTFHEAIRTAVGRARLRGEMLSLAVLDLDDFRVINEMRGHRAGDRLLMAVAAALREFTHEGDMLARVGGDEFALLLDGVEGSQAQITIERARASISAALGLAEHTAMTTSAGICDLATAGGVEQLFELADGALYWSKAHGRDQSCVFDPVVVRELSAGDRARHLERTRTLVGITALARAIDAKDPATRRHSDRVAELATRLARVAGWDMTAVSRLQEAALVHDVGKIGVPDAILLKAGALTAAEYQQMKRHATLGAEMLQGVLSEEQVGWVRGHHERPDGHGYPRALTAGQIDDGAALLAQADAFEAIVTRRVYSPARTIGEAVAECLALSGLQFAPIATRALQALYDEGALDEWSLAGEPADPPVVTAPGRASAAGTPART
jgi:diguanylate cyclase (GGDEF)-like protein